MKRVSLQTKVVIGLLAIALVPLGVAVFFVRQVAEVAQSVAIGEAERLHAALERSRGAYVEAIDARKASFRSAAAAAAADPQVLAACAWLVPNPTSGPPTPPTPHDVLARLIAADHWLGAARLENPEAPALRVGMERDLRGEGRLDPFSSMRLEHPVGQCRLTLTYVTDRGLRLGEDYARLGEVLREHKKIEQIRAGLPPWYGVAFVLSVGGFALALTLLGIFVARRTTKRIDRLVAATRRVAGGDLESRVDVRGRDELGDLGKAFDEMIVQLRRSRAEIEYLEKIGAWQEVARRLAHEIKNPLTPIQLAVQQLHTKYAGDDPRYRKMLDDAHAIVTEEIAGLRRLVDAFSGFAKLPRVEPAPLDLALVVDDVAREAEVEQDPPPSPVTVAADRLLLRRALLNLVENAQQAGAKTVRIGWSGAGGRARLCVDDDGPGVPDELRARVFDPYVTTKPHGTGLGLAIVKKTVLEHDGEITLAPGASPLGGARFELTLPLA